MSKKDQYGLEFLKVTAGGDVGYDCVRKNGIVDENNLLQFLCYLDISRTEFLLKEINFHLDHIPDPTLEPYDSTVLEHMDLQIAYPDFIIDGQPTAFPLKDIKDLLQEWLEFSQS
ncbi:hypothetical protein SAMN05421594_4220 [Chryseobacterium oleae]|uniref:Uncharacterized protein n=1 Tax=Chryseobacterium oleae TaxID=491207 RepID=A0A1I5BW55_CHROL|nr:hypothetical protein [Chryseobacterium oleae]SFN78884.1 hypothetical protein SAMN05421594_4220 [Chryseobacterium oleae]